MTRYNQHIRPAGTAIAALLAIGSTGAFAQDVVLPPQLLQPAPVDAPAATSSPVAPIFAPPAPVVQATVPVNERIAAARAAAEPASSVAADEGPASAPVRRSAVSTATPAPQQRASVNPPVAAPAAAVTQAAPVEPVPPPSTPESAAPVVAAQAEPGAQMDGGNDALAWAMGGAALLLTGLGATFVRRRRHIAVDAPVVADEPVSTIVPPPVVTSPASLARSPVRSNAPVSADQASLEAMVAAPPTPENPFLTAGKRRRRAAWLLAQRNVGTSMPGTPVAVANPLPTTAPVDRSQTVHSFGKSQTGSGFLKPRTS